MNILNPSRFVPVFSRYWSRGIQTLGTPALNVTPSSRKRSMRLTGSRNRSGKTRIALIELRPGIGGRAARDQLLVGRARGELSVRRGAIGHDDELLDALQILRHALQRRYQRGVDEDHLVVGVVDHELEMLGEEARIQGMEHGAGAGNSEVELEVAVVVPGQGADPIPGGDAQLRKRVRQLGDPAPEVGIGVAVTARLPPGHDLLAG